MNKSSPCVKARPWTHRSLPTSWPSFQLSSNPSGRLRKFTVHFQTPDAKRLLSLNHILSLPGVASVNAAFRSGTVLARACVVQVTMSVKHREHAPSPDWWTRGCKHQQRVMRSMLPFIKSLCLLIVPCARPASLLLLIPTPRQCHNHHSNIPPALFFFSLTSHFFQADVLISREVWGSQHGPLSPPVSETLRGRKE